MTMTRPMAGVALIIASGWALQAAWAQRPGITRTPGNGAELATYVVEKGKPLLEIVK